MLEAAGFSAVRHRLHFQTLLSLPVLAAAMALLAAGFSMRSSRRGGVARMIAAGIAAGFSLFVLDRIAGEFGEAGTLPVALAAWAPTVAGLQARADAFARREEERFFRGMRRELTEHRMLTAALRKDLDGYDERLDRLKEADRSRIAEGAGQGRLGQDGGGEAVEGHVITPRVGGQGGHSTRAPCP